MSEDTHQRQQNEAFARLRQEELARLEQIHPLCPTDGQPGNYYRDFGFYTSVHHVYACSSGHLFYFSFGSGKSTPVPQEVATHLAHADDLPEKHD
jgi:hypothetical protein